MDSDSLFKRPKRKVFTSYDHRADAAAFDDFQRQFSSLYEITRDNSLERELDSGDEDAHLRFLGEAMADCGCLLVLCGSTTHKSKFVDWEIKVALDRRMGLLGIVFPGNPYDTTGQPTLPDRLQKNFDHGYAVLGRWEELAKDRIDLTPKIDFAMNRPIDLIDNSSQPRRLDG